MKIKDFFPLLLILLICVNCTVQNKIKNIEKHSASSKLELSIPDDDEYFYEDYEEDINKTSSDTISIIDPEGNKVFFMKATLDSTDTFNVTEALNAAIVTAKFKNIPERNGAINLAFDISIPAILTDTEWQIRLQPKLLILNDTVKLDCVYITGNNYRDKILKGYELYDKFIQSIITDSSKLIYQDLLETFVERNIPKLARIRDMDEEFLPDTITGIYGISLYEARKYFEKNIAKIINNKKIKNKDKMYAKFIKDTIAIRGIKIDSVITDDKNCIKYCYSETIPTKPKLRKINLTLSGGIYKDGKILLEIPDTDSLTFYISSFSTLVENKTKYMTKIIERHAEANMSAYINFATGKYNINEKLKGNKEEIERIKYNMTELINNREFNIDSLVIVATCSPDGRYRTNDILSKQRGKAIGKYLKDYVKKYNKTSDSLDKEEREFTISLEEYDSSRIDDMQEKIEEEHERISDFNFIIHNIPEDWQNFAELVNRDSVIKNKEQIFEILETKNPDKREKLLKQTAYFDYIKENIYPQLRCVRFNFHLHRKGMIKDTVHTTVIDTIYMNGLAAIKDRDYKKAINCLSEYKDENTAIAYLALDYNASAMKVLETLPSSGKRDYMLAVAYSRMGNEQGAIQYFINSKSLDPAMYFRGNLDPEISKLIKKYNIKNH